MSAFDPKRTFAEPKSRIAASPDLILGSPLYCHPGLGHGCISVDCGGAAGEGGHERRQSSGCADTSPANGRTAAVAPPVGAAAGAKPAAAPPSKRAWRPPRRQLGP